MVPNLGTFSSQWCVEGHWSPKISSSSIFRSSFVQKSLDMSWGTTLRSSKFFSGILSLSKPQQICPWFPHLTVSPLLDSHLIVFPLCQHFLLWHPAWIEPAFPWNGTSDMIDISGDICWNIWNLLKYFKSAEIFGKILVEIGSWRDRNLKIWPKLWSGGAWFGKKIFFFKSSTSRW